MKTNYWDEKPYWCQPWSILLFGTFIIFISYIILKSIIISSLVSFVILIWWTLFLYLAPRFYKDDPL